MYFSTKEKTLIFVYNILVHIAGALLKVIALFNSKIRLGVKGRINSFKVLQSKLTESDLIIWFHCASLGEYEQGLPVFEEIKKIYPKHKIVLTFFSPSGYEIRKNTEIADCVVYLPLDTKKNASRFIEFIKPELIVFVKYEIWPNYLRQIKEHQIKAILISAIFRENHLFFKPIGRWMQKYLRSFTHIFVQNNSSMKTLNSIGFQNVTVAGDTRYDRVSKQLQSDNSLPFMEQFIDGNLCFVAGSTWPEGEAYICNFINSNQDNNVKYIIAPHDIKKGRIRELKKKLKVSSILFSEMNGKNLKAYKVFIVDTIGLLTKIYSYADISYVGGAAGTTGLHNILEPAVFGLTVVIGSNYRKFPEASLMIKNGGVISVKNENQFKNLINKLVENDEFRKKSGKLNSSFIEKNKGAVNQIVSFLRK